MPLTVQQLNSERAEFDWPYSGDTLHVTYNPQAFTPAVERRLTDEMKGEYKAEVLSFMLSLLLVDWDLQEFVPKLDANGAPVLDDSGQPVYEVDEDNQPKERPYGVSLEKLNELPITFIGDAIQAITADIQAIRESGKASDGGSPQKATLESLPTGTPS